MRRLHRSLSICFFVFFALCSTAYSEGCPDSTKLNELNGWDKFKESGPYDLGTVNKATAAFVGKRMHIILSNSDVAAKDVASNITQSQVEGKGQLALDILLSNSSKPLVVGTYSPKNRFGKMSVKTTLMIPVEGGASGLSANDGEVKVESVSDEQVCGTFALSTPYGPVSGQFVAPIEKVG